MDTMCLVFVNEHAPEECQALFEEAMENPFPAALKGTALPCLCRSGIHTAYFTANGEDGEALLAALPPKYRAGTRVLEGDVVTIGQEIPVA